MEAFSFIPFLEIWTISNHTGIGDTNVHACRIYIHYIHGLRGVSFYLVWWVCPEPLKQIILTVPRLNRNRVCINLIYSYYILFFSRFDTVKFPFLLFSQKTIFCKCLWFFVGRWNNNRATIDRKGNKSYKETAFLLSS